MKNTEGIYSHPSGAAMLGRSFAAGIRDLVTGAGRWRLWYLIGSAEMRRRFARARLGQLWIMLSSALSVSIIGLTWALLWKQPVEDMLPFVAASLTIWQFLAAVLNDAATAFPQYSHYFLNQYMPASVRQAPWSPQPMRGTWLARQSLASVCREG